MSRLIHKYQTTRNKIIERAIHINNMLYDLKLPDELEGYRPSYCGVHAKYLQNSVINDYSVNLIYPEPYEDYEEAWVITSSYIDMNDEEIVADFIRCINIRYGRDKQHRFDSLKRDAEWFGFILVEKNGHNE